MRLLLATFLSLTACNHLTVVQTSGAPSEPTKVVTMHSYLWGFIPTQIAPSACEEMAPQSYHFFMDSGDVTLAIVTAGIYIPSEIELTCR